MKNITIEINGTDEVSKVKTMNKLHFLLNHDKDIENVVSHQLDNGLKSITFSFKEVAEITEEKKKIKK